MRARAGRLSGASYTHRGHRRMQGGAGRCRGRIGSAAARRRAGCTADVAIPDHRRGRCSREEDEIAVSDRVVGVAHERLVPAPDAPAGIRAAAGAEIEFIVVAPQLADAERGPVPAPQPLPDSVREACQDRPEHGREPGRGRVRCVALPDRIPPLIGSRTQARRWMHGTESAAGAPRGRECARTCANRARAGGWRQLFGRESGSFLRSRGGGCARLTVRARTGPEMNNFYLAIMLSSH